MDGGLDVFLPFAGATAEPVVVAQLVEHGTTDALAGKGLKLHALAGFEARESVGQPDHADLDEVIQLHTGWQLGQHVVGNAPHQRSVLADESVTIQLAVGGVHQLSDSTRWEWLGCGG